MARLPDLAESGQQSVPQASGGVASYEPPNWRQVGMAGQVVSSAGRDIQDTANILQATNERQDQVTALDAANKLKAAQLSLQLDPKSGFTNVRTSGVIGPQFVQSYTDKFNEAKSQIEDGLQGGNQKRLFQQHAEVLGLQFQSNLLLHQAKETAVFNKATRDTTVNLSLNDIAAHPYDDNTYDANVALMGRAVVDQGKEMGLTGDALANWVRAGTQQMNSKGLMYRTSGMLLDNPMKAADFFHQHELDFDPQDRMHLAGQIKTATDAQTTRIGGQQSYQAAIGAPPEAPLPADKGASFVKPYAPERIDQIVSMVKKPSPYDADINAAAQAFNISPVDLKMRLVVESGLDPNAKATDRGGNVLASGIAQFSPKTAAAYGLDTSDPKASIFAAAKYIAQAGGTVGGDMGKVDRAYYGGSTNAGGPNTDQYAENLRAVRARMFGAPRPVLTEAYLEGAEGRVIDNAKAWAQSQRPGDLVYQDQVVSEARKNWANDYTAIRGKNQQVVSGIASLMASDTPPKTVGDLPPQLRQAYSQLPGTTQEQIFNRLKNGDKKLDQQSASIYYQLLGTAANDPAQFAGDGTRPGIDLSQYFGTMPDHLLLSLMGTQKSMATRDAQAQAKGANMTRALTIANDYALKPLGIQIPNKDTPQAKRDTYDQFTGRLSEAVDNFVTSKGHTPTDSDLISIAKNLTTTVQVPGKWFGTTDKRAFEVTPEQLGTATVKVPDDFKAGITASITKKTGKPPTPAQVTTAYMDYLRGAR